MIGLAMSLLGAVGVLVTALAQLSPAPIVVSLFLLVSGTATTTPPTTSLALAFGGLAAPLVGLGGAGTAVPLGMVAVAATGLAMVAYAVSIRRHVRGSEPAVASSQPLARATTSP